MRCVFFIGVAANILGGFWNAVTGYPTITAIHTATGWFCLWAAIRDYPKPPPREETP